MSRIKGILFLHGGGHSSSARYQPIVDFFAHYQFYTHVFDHQSDSLAGRLVEAQSELLQFSKNASLTNPQICVWGSSMGAHVACRLSENNLDLGALILQSAAAYSQAAESVPFGPQFTYALETTTSWDNSPAITALNKYLGPVQVIYGGQDDIIPEEVQSLYRARAERGGSFTLIPPGGHSMLRPETSEQQVAWQGMANAALTFLQSLE